MEGEKVVSRYQYFVASVLNEFKLGLGRERDKVGWDTMPKSKGRDDSSVKEGDGIPVKEVKEGKLSFCCFEWLAEGKVELGDGVAQKADQAANGAKD